MSLIVALTSIAVLAVVMLVFVGTERGPQPADVAIAYERAWQRHDWSTLFDLSAKEMRDGLARDQFVSAKRKSVTKSLPDEDTVVDVTIDEVVAVSDAASVVTRLVAQSGSAVRSRVLCERRNGRWQVVAHNLVTEAT